MLRQGSSIAHQDEDQESPIGIADCFYTASIHLLQMLAEHATSVLVVAPVLLCSAIWAALPALLVQGRKPVALAAWL